LLALLASIAFFTIFGSNSTVDKVAIVLFHVLNLWVSIALAVFTTIYIYKEHEDTFNRIFYKDVGVVLTLLVFLCGIANILDCGYLYPNTFNTIKDNYYAIRLLFSIVCLFLSFPVYIKVKENKNLELGSGYGLSAFISQLSSFLTAELIMNVYQLIEDSITQDVEFHFWYKNSLNLAFFIISVYIIFSYNDFFFGLGFTGYSLLQIVVTASTYQTLVPVIFYFIIGLGYTGFIFYKHGRECIGISL
jgi:hypothetical protein